MAFLVAVAVLGMPRGLAAAVGVGPAAVDPVSTAESDAGRLLHIDVDHRTRGVVLVADHGLAEVGTVDTEVTQPGDPVPDQDPVHGRGWHVLTTCVQGAGELDRTDPELAS